MFRKDLTKQEKIFYFCLLFFLGLLESIACKYININYPMISSNPFYTWITSLITGTTYSVSLLYIGNLLENRLSIISRIIKIFAIIAWCINFVVVTLYLFFPTTF